MVCMVCFDLHFNEVLEIHSLAGHSNSWKPPVAVCQHCRLLAARDILKLIVGLKCGIHTSITPLLPDLYS